VEKERLTEKEYWDDRWDKIRLPAIDHLLGNRVPPILEVPRPELEREPKYLLMAGKGCSTTLKSTESKYATSSVAKETLKISRELQWAVPRKHNVRQWLGRAIPQSYQKER